MIALVLGGADCLQADFDEASALVDPHRCTIIATNDAGVYWPQRLDHWVTMHPTELPYRVQRRRTMGHPDGYTTWTRPYPPGMKDREAICDRTLSGYNGSSGLVAVGVAIETGHHAILCGMPMDVRPHFNRDGVWEAAASYRERWIELHDRLAPLVRSLSGWTRQRFGAPTHEWVDSARRPHVASGRP